jgi:hypothetical protein
VSTTVDVGVDIILEFVQANPHLALLSNNELNIIPKEPSNLIRRDLQHALTSTVVDLPAFVQKYDVSRESVAALLSAEQSNVSENEQCLFSDVYEQTLSTAVGEQLKYSLKEAQPIELRSSGLTGQPPVWLIERVLRRLQEEPEMASQFYTVRYGDAVRCIPKQSVTQKRDELIEQLQSGQPPFLDSRHFAAKFNQLYASQEEALSFLGTISDTSLMAHYVVSNKWLDAIVDDALRKLDEDGFVDCAVQVHDLMSANVRKEIVDSIARNVMEKRTSEPVRIAHFVVTSPKYTVGRDTLFDLARAQAKYQWHDTKEMINTEFEFSMSDFVAAIPRNQTLPQIIALEHAMEPLLSEQFSTQISKLELENETEFGEHWAERVATRMHAYNEGMEAIEDPKLQGQLAELLATYLQKDLIPDALAKAQSQGLVRSRKTRKNGQKLETALKAGNKDLSGVRSSLDKFAKKQDLQAVDDTPVVETKKAMVNDMIRRMHKPKTEGPLLFLTLVLVLFAKHYPGVIYATGKFAPKLLKQLKSKLSAADYEQAETWKELAKTGALTKNDKEAMRRMADLDG